MSDRTVTVSLTRGQANVLLLAVRGQLDEDSTDDWFRFTLAEAESEITDAYTDGANA